MNDALREAAAVAPEWAKKEARRQLVLKATVAGVLAALAVGTAAFVLGARNAERITRVEHSACQEDAASLECQQTKREAARAANIVTTCIPFFKAGYPCPKPGSTADERQTRRQGQSGSGSAQELDSSSTPAPPSISSPGEVAAPEGDGHKAPVPHHPGSKAPAVPPTPAPSAEPNPVLAAPSSEVDTEVAGVNSPPEDLPPPPSQAKATLDLNIEAAIHPIVCSLAERLRHPDDC